MKKPFVHLVLALILVILVIVGYGVWYATVSSKSSEVADLQSKISAATNTVSRIAAARSALAEIAGDEAKVQSYFVPESGVVPFINSLEALGVAQKASVSVLSVSSGGPAPHPFLSLSLAVTGTFDAIMRTIGAIEYAPYDISIASLSIGQDAKNGWHASLTLTVGSVPPTTTP